MHEGAVAQALFHTVTSHLPAGAVLTAAHVEVGEYEHIDEAALRFFWDALTEETPYSGSALHVRWRPVRVRCGGCGHRYVPEDKAILVCPACGAVRPDVVEGKGIYLSRLEIENRETDMPEEATE